MIRNNGYSDAEPVLVALDCIIFGFDEGELKLLLVRRDIEPEKGKWSLMGGFLKKDEPLSTASKRILNELTGISQVYMEQLHTFGEVERDPVERTLSVAYYALINIADHNHDLSEKFGAHWFPFSQAPSLIFDHNEMVKRAIEQLRHKASVLPIGLELLPEKFTMPQLQQLYEAIYATQLDKRNFSKKILSQDVLIKLDEKQKGYSKKGAFYYKFDHEKYKHQENTSPGFML